MQARVFWQMNPGRNVVNLNWDAINADSVVLVSASEYNSNSQQLPDGTDQRFVGAADVTVANVTPHGPPFDPNHGVTFVVEVGWGSPLTICTDIAIIADQPDAVLYVGPQVQSREVKTTERAAVQTTIEARKEPVHVLSASVGAASGGALGSASGGALGSASGGALGSASGGALGSASGRAAERSNRITRHEATIKTRGER